MNVSVSSLSLSCESPDRDRPKSTSSSVGRGATDVRPQERQDRVAQVDTAWGCRQNCSCLGQKFLTIDMSLECILFDNYISTYHTELELAV